MNAQHLDKLNADARAMIAFLMANPLGSFLPDYMVEVKLDKPLENILYADDETHQEVLHRHSGNGSREYANYYGNDEWAVVHNEDKDWVALDKKPLLERAEEIIAGLRSGQ